jgi:hypothetical protein
MAHGPIMGPFDIVMVSELPPLHKLFKCAHAGRFDVILETVPATGNRLARRLQAGRLFVASLTPDDCASCDYHASDWLSIAQAAVSVVRRAGDCPTSEEIERGRKLGHVKRRDEPFYWSLFDDPIVFGKGQFWDGQHRACAVRLSGVRELVVRRY